MTLIRSGSRNGPRSGPRTGPRFSTRAWLALVAAISVAAVGAALVTQHVYGMQPCPWCVLQRVIFLAIAAVALLAMLLPRSVRKVAIAVLGLLAAGGIAAALWQHFVAAESASCNMTLADRIVGQLQLDALWPEVFMATATCAEAKVKLLGLPYEFWSLALFVLIGAIAVKLLLRRARRR